MRGIAQVPEHVLHRERLVHVVALGARLAFDRMANGDVPVARLLVRSERRSDLEGEEASVVRRPGDVVRAEATSEALDVAPVVAALAVAHGVGVGAVDAGAAAPEVADRLYVLTQKHRRVSRNGA